MLAALSDPEPRVREHALRLAEPFCTDDDADSRTDGGDGRRHRPARPLPVGIFAGCAAGYETGTALSPRWRSATGRIPGCEWPFSAPSRRCTGEVFHRLADNAAFRSSRHGQALLTALAAQTGAAERADDLAAVLKELDGPLAGDKPLSGDIVMALLSKASAASQAQLGRQAAATSERSSPGF